MIQERLRLLMGKMRANELARKVSLPSTTLYNLLSGTNIDTRLSSLLPLANYFNVSVDFLIGREAMTKNSIWNIPCLQEEDVESWIAGKLNPASFINVADNLQNPITKKCFSLIAKSEPMSHALPIGSHLIFNSELKPKNHDIVFIKLASGNYILRKIIHEGNNEFLVSANPQFSDSIKRAKNDDCLGVLTMSISFHCSGQ